MSDVFVCEIQLPRAPKKRKREPAERRTFNKARRLSIFAGQEVRVPWKRRDAERATKALKAYVLGKHVPGKRLGADGNAGRIVITLYEKLAYAAADFAGNLFPSEEKLAEWCGCGPSSINVAKAWLRKEGWLDWDNRIVALDRAGVRGPQVQQTSNFYRVLFPRVARKMLEAWKAARASRAPEDALHARQMYEAWVKGAEREVAQANEETNSPAIRRAAEKQRDEIATYVGSERSSTRLC